MINKRIKTKLREINSIKTHNTAHSVNKIKNRKSYKGIIDKHIIRDEKNHFIIAVFFISIVFPGTEIAGLSLSPARVFLLIMFIPLFYKLITGKIGRFCIVDKLIICFCIWSSITFILSGGLSMIAFAGMNTIEILGSYLLGRNYISSILSFRKLVNIIFTVTIFLGLLAAIESLTGIQLIQKITGGNVNPEYAIAGRVRWGMYRAASIFPTPIHFGIIMSMGISLFYMTMNPKNGKPFGIIKAWAAPFAVFFSLSSGAFLPMFIQFILIYWDKFMKTRNKWKIIAAIFLFLYILVDLGSNRTPFHVMTSYATFNSSSSYTRIIIFDHGIKNVWINPVFGLGLNEWVRPSWLGASVDNFWLLLAMRHGIPGFLIFLGMLVAWFWSIGTSPLVETEAKLQRKGLLMSIFAAAVALCTVHIWGVALVYFMLLLGAGMWLIDEKVASIPCGSNPRSKRQSLKRKPLATQGFRPS